MLNNTFTLCPTVFCIVLTSTLSMGAPTGDRDFAQFTQALQATPYILLGRLSEQADNPPEHKDFSPQFLIQKVVKSPPQSQIKASSTIRVIQTSKGCPLRMSPSLEEPFYVYATGPNSQGGYELFQSEDCILAKATTSTQGLLKVFAYTLSPQQLSQLAQSTGEIRSLTIDPMDLSRNPKASTVTYTPNSRVRRSSYTRYIFDQTDFEAILGPQLERPIKVLVELDPVQKSIHRPDHSLPQPKSGFQITKYRARVVTKL